MIKFMDQSYEKKKESVLLPCPKIMRIKVLCVISMFLFLCTGPAVGADRVLLLLTPETNAIGVSIMSNIIAEFNNVSPALDLTIQQNLNSANTVTDGTFTHLSGNPYDVVVVVSVYTAIHSSNWAAINTAIEQREADSFIMFTDSCPTCNANNRAYMINALNNAASFTASQGNQDNNYFNFNLNTSSPYSASFIDGGLTTFRGGWLYYMNNIPIDNILYLPRNVSPPLTGTLGSATAVFVPATQSYDGNGACIFSIIDASVFDMSHCNNCYSTNQGKIAASFLAAASRSGGACGYPASITMSFSPDLVGLGWESTLKIAVHNMIDNPITGLRIENTLPAPLIISGNPTSNCGGSLIAEGAQTIKLSNATLPLSGCTITVPVQWPSNLAGEALCNEIPIINTITPGLPPTGEFSTDSGQADTPASASISCSMQLPVKTEPKPVPINSLATILFSILALMLTPIYFRSRI